MNRALIEADRLSPGKNANTLPEVRMSDRTPTAIILPLIQPAWTGTLDFDIYNSYDWNVATIRLSIRTDTVEVWCDDRCVAVTARDDFEIWLHKPSATLSADEIAWTTDREHSCIVIVDSPPYVIPAHVIPFLRRKV